MVVLQTNQVDAFSLHSPMLKHDFQVLHTILLNHPSVDNLVSIGGGPQHAAPKKKTNKKKGSTTGQLQKRKRVTSQFKTTSCN